ncbi:hypothetical protein PR048_023292 [Dryococelus australis]|uniref:Uncharacterized protein n=1 Tax=Dryococelus australis TaxID=614101 RepID=A0ABQ9GTP8_9NEOP|nr:hypothetical protein PR048_023292 [Dryococelus australis]
MVSLPRLWETCYILLWGEMPHLLFNSWPEERCHIRNAARIQDEARCTSARITDMVGFIRGY